MALFVVLGGFVGEHLKHVSPLKGYGINLAGSLLGMALFATLSFLDSGPAIWLLVGFIFLLPFFVRQYVTLALLVVAIAAVAIPKSGTLWSPYYRIDFTPMPSPQGSSHPSAYSIVANHSWYQWVVDLLPAFLKSHPEAKPNSFLFPQYELPYEIVPSPKMFFWGRHRQRCRGSATAWCGTHRCRGTRPCYSPPWKAIPSRASLQLDKRYLTCR